MPKTWIVIANASRARIVEADTLRKVEGFTHAATRAKVSELVSGKRGRTHTDIESGYSAYERHTDPHQAQMDVFAREIAARLHAGRVHGEVENIVLVAAPAFLGRLRGAMEATTAKLVTASFDHDWTADTDEEVLAHIRQHTH